MTDEMKRMPKNIGVEIDKLGFDKATPEGLYRPMHYILSQGGKRLRPLIALLAYQAYSGVVETAPVLPILRAVELFHNFSLLHDDVMDDAPMRRGLPTVYKKWGLNAAILSGDGMLVEAYRQLEGVSPDLLPQVLARFNDMALAVCKGQQLDTDYEERPLDHITIEEYMDMIRMKTAHLFMGAAALGALVASAPSMDVELMGRGVERMGLAFQLMDDWLDVFSEAEFGKIKGGDILEGKRTWLLITAYKRSPERVSEVLGIRDEVEKIERMTRLYQELGVDRDALGEVERLSNEGIECLDQLSITADQIAPLKILFSELIGRKI